MTTPAQLEIVERHVADAVAKGARALTGGKRREGPGYFYEPTVLVDVDHTMLAMTEETFGPTVPIMRVADAEEAVRLANDSPYGLAASIYGDRERAEQLARRLEAGAVCVNDALLNYLAVELPMGGWKASGLGTRHGAAGIRKYTKQQALMVSRVHLKRELFMFPYRPASSKLLVPRDEAAVRPRQARPALSARPPRSARAGRQPVDARDRPRAGVLRVVGGRRLPRRLQEPQPAGAGRARRRCTSRRRSSWWPSPGRAARGRPAARRSLAGLGAGLFGIAALMAFYRALAIGTMSIVAPVASTGVALPVLVGLATGDQPGLMRSIGLAAAVVGVVLASREDDAALADPRLQRQSIALAVVAGLGFGSYFVFAEIASRGDVAWALLLSRTAATPFVIAFAVHRPAPRWRASERARDRSRWPGSGCSTSARTSSTTSRRRSASCRPSRSRARCTR